MLNNYCKLVLLICCITANSGCSRKTTEAISPVIEKKAEPVKKIWVKTDPVQCRGNAWEKDWQKSNREFYPKEKEKEVIIAYYKKQNTTVFELKTKRTHEDVCEACTCPRGDTLYLLIAKGDEDKMLELGYKHHVDGE